MYMIFHPEFGIYRADSGEIERFSSRSEAELIIALWGGGSYRVIH